ncbi:hypothetical protein [Methylocaldum sp.]|uniref:hypothetical protein n=1 Tax=Methylocaldum sp. TaxID=1969727 RepID=UPI002D5342D7|nr:hypothetical protein [Methylocaldum sp.]HYE34094.1 hypothetical protein [Methylocaldum sp.]
MNRHEPHIAAQERQNSQATPMRITRLIYDSSGLRRIICRQAGCFPYLDVKRGQDESEAAFRRRAGLTRGVSELS